MAVLSLHCWSEFSLVVVSRGYSLVTVWSFLIAVAYLMGHCLWGVWSLVVVAHRLSSWGLRALEYRLSRCGGRVQFALQHVGSSQIRFCTLSPALAGRFFPTELPGRCSTVFNNPINFIQISALSFYITWLRKTGKR